MTFDLKRENWVSHNCNTERMIDWCVENLLGHDGVQQGQYGFGCSCEETSDKKELEKFESSYCIGVIHLTERDEEWEGWMSDISNGEIKIHFCSQCKEWMIDNVC